MPSSEPVCVCVCGGCVCARVFVLCGRVFVLCAQMYSGKMSDCFHSNAWTYYIVLGDARC